MTEENLEAPLAGSEQQDAGADAGAARRLVHRRVRPPRDRTR